MIKLINKTFCFFGIHEVTGDVFDLKKTYPVYCKHCFSKVKNEGVS
jgi:predicted methyltransferase